MNLTISSSLYRPLFAGICFAFLAACATVPSVPPQEASAAVFLKAAQSTRATAQQRAALYLRAAALSAPLIGSANQDPQAIQTYNTATEELTILLRSADDGSLWNKPLSFTAGGKTYQLRYTDSKSEDVWSPNYFTAFESVSDVKMDLVKTPNVRSGVGGVLIGVRKLDPGEAFAPRVGITAPVTTTLTFQGDNATLVLNDPTEKATVTMSGEKLPLAANFSAPLCYYPDVNATLLGLMEALRPAKYTDRQGLFMLQPFDPTRIPVIYVHGLASTPYIWRDPINQIEEDPELRAKYQAIVYSYPTGNPAAFSALQFREELAEFAKTHPMPHGFVLISHSMGGLLSQMQTETVTRADWHRLYPERTDALFAKVTPDSNIYRAMTFDANPDVKRVVFISTPHKGANMATESIGQFAIKLISLPVDITHTITSTLGNEIGFILGNKDNRLPTSVSSLAPSNPMLHVLASKKVIPPSHSIIGNRGRSGPLADSSDGVVPYWSSHLGYAQSEVIVPGPHSCYGYPEAAAELKRILRLHLKSIR